VNVGIGLGFMVCIFCGLPLASLTPAEAVTTDLWMITYFVPIVAATISIILMLVAFTHEPLNFLLARGEKEEALKLIAKVYLCNEAN
jgi:hypothetical protein